MRDDGHVYWKPFPYGAEDLWRMQPWPGGARALARTIGTGIQLLLRSFLAIGACFLGGWHSLALFRRWADRLPERLERALVGQSLAYAVAHQVLTRTASGYTFSDPALRADLAARYQAGLDARAREQASRSAQTNRRKRLLALLDDRAIDRISTDVAASAGVYVVTLAFADLHTRFPLSAGQTFLLGVLVLGGLLEVRAAAPLIRWTVASMPGLSRVGATVTAVLTAGGLATLVIASGPVLAAALAALLPAAFVAACGLWVCLVTARPRGRHRARRPLPYLPDVIAIVTVGVAAAVLVRRSLFTTGPATVLLFPIATWGILRAWRVMDHSRRLTIRAAADLTLSLLLGAELVLFAVWLLNLLALSQVEVTTLRAALDRAGRLADLPWWTWAATYLILAATSIALGYYPGLSRKVADLLRLAPVAGAAKRVLTGMHIGLLVIVFIAVSAPASITPLLQHQIRIKYDVALQRELEAARVLAAYTRIRAALGPGALKIGPLPAMVVTIYEIAHGQAGDNPTELEDDLARRLGRLQATTLTFTHSPPPQTANAVGTSATGLDEDLGKLSAAEQEGGTIVEWADQTGEFLAAAIASAISIPHVSDHEVVQIVREYLSGLIEESPLKDVIATWYRNIHMRVVPRADDIVVPDATRLEKAALAELNDAAPGGQDVTNVLRATHDETSAVATVELANATRYEQEGTGPCDSICRLAAPPGGPEPVVKPPEPVEPEPPADPFGDIPH